MLFLLNSTKTMKMDAVVPPRLKVTNPRQLERSRILADKISKMSLSQLIKQMSLSEKLAIETKKNAAKWGLNDRPKTPALFAFTGLLYKSLDPFSLNPTQRNDAQKRICILSGLYGLLRPFDLIEIYRLEMGQKLAVGKTKNMVAFWKQYLTIKLNEVLKVGEPIINLAAQEYMNALYPKELNGPVISPVFKEEYPNGTYKTVTVHAKKARGEMMRYALITKARTPRDLLGFKILGWRAADEQPKFGPWLFTRPVTP